MDTKARFREKVSKLLFLELDPNRIEKLFNISLEENIYVPLRGKTLYDSISSGQNIDNVSIGFFIEGMFFVLGGDEEFKFNKIYKEILFDDNYIKYIKGIIVKLATNNELEDAYILLKGLLEVEGTTENYEKFFVIAQEILLSDKSFEENILEVVEDAKKLDGFLTPYLVESTIFEAKGDYQSSLFALNNYISSGGESTKEVLDRQERLKKVRAYEKGKELIDASPIEALECLVPLTEEFSDDAILYYYIGKAYRKAERYDLALEALNIALALDNNLSDVVYDIGLNLACIGEYKEALKYFLKVFENLKNIEVCTNVIMCYYYLDDKKSAREYIEIAEKINPSDEVLLQLKNLVR